MINKMRLSEQLKIHEGVRSKPYHCTANKLTIGVGRNLDDVGLSSEEIDYLLSNDIGRVHAECRENFTWFAGLTGLQQEAIINLIFNMGLTTFKKFKKTIQHIENGEFELAGAELLNSRYADQVGQRAVEVANQLAGK
tara:strand:- start:1103 stop:1516 length:414 start_codon:yes stop_codon:yes gene_type:complete